MKNRKTYILTILFFSILFGDCNPEKVNLGNCDCKKMDLVVSARKFQTSDSISIGTLKDKIVDLNPIEDDGRVIFGDTIIFNCSNNVNISVLINEDYTKIQDIKYEPQISISKILRNLESRNYVRVKIEETLLDKDSLKDLSLRDCNLYSIPKEVFELQNLEFLDLSVNLIKEIPDEISKLKNLKELSISYNLLETISPKISKLELVEKIWFLDNNLKSLPTEICELKRLKKLNLTLNPIKKLPTCIPEMISLRTIGLGTESKHSKKLLNQIEEFKIRNQNLLIVM